MIGNDVGMRMVGEERIDKKIEERIEWKEVGDWGRRLSMMEKEKRKSLKEIKNDKWIEGDEER